MTALTEGTQNAILAVLGERVRQMQVEGWTTEHDDQHRDGSLAIAAAVYALASAGIGWAAAALWPWSFTWWKPRDRHDNLVRAAALLVAEIERIHRWEGVPT